MSPECQVTIEDPLISRNHARIDVSLTECVYHDLGSRNGSKINGKVVKQPIVLRDADRIRLGAQELVFFELKIEARATRQTGALVMCHQCLTPYPEGTPSCPHCGALPPVREDETMSGLIIEPRRTWMLSLLGEVLERALNSNKLSDAERILQRATEEFDERMNSGEQVEPRYLVQLGEYAVRLAVLQHSAKWIEWLFQALQRTDRIPGLAVVERLKTAMHLTPVTTLCRAMVARWRDHMHLLSSEERTALELLRATVGTSASDG